MGLPSKSLMNCSGIQPDVLHTMGEGLEQL